MRIAIIGAPGIGKTTQSQLLAKSLNVPVISIGEDLRELARGADEKAREVREALEKGELVSNEISLELLHQHLSKPETQKGFVLDGMPRTSEEARALSTLFAFDRVFHLTGSLSVVMERLIRRKREDDQAKIISRRFEIYEQEKEAVLEIYRGLGILVEIDASNPSVAEIQQEIVANLR